MTVLNVADLVPQFLSELQQKADPAFKTQHPRFGLKDLDRVTRGFRPGELTVIGGRPAMGKTSLMVNIATEVAVEQGFAVLILCESTESYMVMRLLATRGELDLGRLSSGQLLDQEWYALSKVVEELRNAKVYVQRMTGMTGLDVAEAIGSAQHERGPLDIVLIDGLNLSRDSPEHADHGAKTLLLKNLAGKLQIPIVLSTLMSSSPGASTAMRPVLSDLSEVEAVERDADVVMFVFREQYYGGGSELPFGVAEVMVARNRCGPTASVKLGFRQGMARFENL